jgi:hypothetical protein
LIEDVAELMNSGLNILKSFSSALHVTVLQWNHLLLLFLLLVQQRLTLSFHLLPVEWGCENGENTK